ncbi:MAG: hypothetical protein SFW36_07870, partial [Leptolyngbyaceae cyanobacterium bins.59]|nr:hypothetical protein [Leptolyngbyaceae cyanobacterium bins.59]
MLNIPGYQVKCEIYGSSNSLIYRGYRETDALPVILKVLRSDYPTPEALARYWQEYEIIYRLALAGVVKAYEILPYQNTLAIVLEDFG